MHTHQKSRVDIIINRGLGGLRLYTYGNAGTMVGAIVTILQHFFLFLFLSIYQSVDKSISNIRINKDKEESYLFLVFIYMFAGLCSIEVCEIAKKKTKKIEKLVNNMCVQDAPCFGWTLYYSHHQDFEQYLWDRDKMRFLKTCHNNIIIGKEKANFVYTL